MGYTGPETGDTSRIVISRISLRELITAAYQEYGQFGERISGPPSIENYYSLAATLPRGSTDKKNITQMYRNLLTERFGLKFHEESKDGRGFELTIGQSGFKLIPSTAEVESVPSNREASVMPIRPDPDAKGFPVLTPLGTWGVSYDQPSGVIRITFRRCSMYQLADMLSSMYGQRSVPVIDKTGIKDLFDFHLVLPTPPVRVVVTPGLASQLAPPNSPSDSVIDLHDLSGSLEKQTGLRLKAVNVTLRMMVIDSVDRRPTEN